MAERLGISLKRLDGWEPTTRYKHDTTGRLVSSTPEPEWDAEQQGIMLALTQYRRLLCPCGCGHFQADTTAPEGTVSWHVPSPPACTARMKLSAAQKRMQDFPNPEALLWHVEKR